MNAKKTVISILVLAMALALTACAGGGNAILDPTPTPAPTAEPTPEPTAEPTPEPTPEPTAEPTPEPTAEPTPEPTAEPAAKAKASADEEDVFGLTDVNVYHNGYFGITCVLPESWTVASQEDLLALQGMTGQVLEQYNNDYAEYYDQLLEDNTMCYVLAAYSGDGTKNVIIQLEHLEGVTGLIDESDLLDLALEQIGDSLDSMGMTAEANTFTLAGQEHAGLSLTSVTTVGELEFPMTQQMVLILQGDYALQITMTNAMDSSGDGIADMAAFFTAD